MRGRIITGDQLLAAMKAGGRVDSSASVLNPDAVDDSLVISTPGYGAHLPPFLSPAFENEGLTEPESEEGGTAWRSFRRFELLSLAARTRLAGRSLPQPNTSDPVADRIRRINLKGFAEVRAASILETLALVADELGPDQGRRGKTQTAEQLAMRNGLQLIGCRITDDLDADGLRLVNARLPISLRFIGCVIECPLLLAHCELVSLDLSGSAMNALDATGLQASGNVHLRRTAVRSPVSFSGARIAGGFDASDAVLAPFKQTVPQIPILSDHGMLNLSGATIENEVSLARARIWGGLSLRGVKIGRSLFLNQAVLASPMALLEKWGGDRARRRARDDSHPRPEWAALESVRVSEADSLAVRRLHEPGWPEGAPSAIEAESDADSVHEALLGALTDMEILSGETERWRNLYPVTLRRMKSRAITSALRADGAMVEGTVFARAILCSGRFRMRYARIGGSLRLEGSWLRSPKACERSVHALSAAVDPAARDHPPRFPREWEAFLSVWRTLMARRDMAAADYEAEAALDLQSIRLVGDLSLGPGTEAPTPPQRGPLPRRKTMPTQVDGEILLRGLKTEGAIIMRGLKSRPPKLRIEPLRSGFIRSRRQMFMHWSRRVRTVDMDKVETGQDIDLRNTDGLCGVFMDNARIGGDLLLADKSNGRMTEDRAGYVRCPNRARNMWGRLSLKGTEIRGDAHLVFDNRRGPIISANHATVGGRLDIYPQIGAGNYQRRPTMEQDRTRGIAGGDEDKIGEWEGGFWLDACDHAQVELRPREGEAEGGLDGRVCKDCHLVLDHLEDNSVPYIDLRQARTSTFSHPPAAWPDPGALSLDGFRYEQTSDLGPLAPQTPPRFDLVEVFAKSAGAKTAVQNALRLQYRWRYRRVRRFVMFAVAICLALAVILASTLYGWTAVRSGLDLLGYEPAVTIVVLTAMVCATTLALIGLRFIQPGLRGRRRQPWVHADRVKPRALEYLARQRTSTNRFKLRPSSYHVLDSYVRAARALREGGRYISANLVEEERLRLRTRMLSWRHHGPAKALLTLVDAFAGYGFRLSRAVLCLCITVLTVAGAAHWAAANDYLVATGSETGHPVYTSTHRVRKSVKCGSVGEPAAAADCPDVVFAMDLLLPMVDLGEAERWRTALPERAPEPAVEPFRSLWRSFLHHWPGLVGMLGLVLTAIMAAAVAARVESAFARVEE